MLLKTRLILVFTFALIVFGVAQAYLKFQDLQGTISAEIRTRDAANNVIWLKIISQVSQNMQFYAQNTESGGSPIWSLRGKRSPVQSIKSGKAKRLEVTLTPFFEDLSGRGVIDALAVYTKAGDLLYDFGSEDNVSFFDSHSVPPCSVKNNAQILHNGNMTSVAFAFDVFSNGVPVGCVVYSKNFKWLASKYFEDTGSEVFVESVENSGVTIPFSFSELLTSLISDKQQYVAITHLPSNFEGQQVQLFSFTDMTPFVARSLKEKYRDLLLLALYLTILFGILIVLMSNEFSKLNIAIHRLQDLSKGRLTRDDKLYENNEVGSIMTAVQQLNQTIDSYSSNRKNTEIQREAYIGNLYQSIEDMSVHLPEELRLNVQSQIGKNSTEHDESSDSGNIFAEKEDNSIRLVNEVLGGISKEINTQIERQTELTESYQRFVPAEIVTALDKGSITQVELGDQKQRETYILFTDIRDFTVISEKLDSQQVFELLNKLLEVAIPTIRKAGGYIDKFIGDAILAVFETEDGDPVRCGIDLLKSLKTLNIELSKNYDVEISVGIGIHYGPVVLGTIGNEYRMEGTVVGDTVNTASRLEALTKKLKTPLLVSGEVVKKMRADKRWRYCIPRRLSSEPLKGKTERVDVFEIADWRSKNASEVIANSAGLTSSYIDAVASGHISEELKEEFRAFIDKNPWDEAAQVVFNS